MNFKEYIKCVKITEAEDQGPIKQRLADNSRLMHAVMGLQTETAELTDQLKKVVMYGKALDRTNLEEEAGDALWYMALLVDELGLDFESILDKNIAKLKARYGEKFTNDAALNRDLEKERTILEKNA